MIGCGTVGGGVLELLDRQARRARRALRRPVPGHADRGARPRTSRGPLAAGIPMTTRALDLVGDPEVDVIVEVAGGDAVEPALTAALAAGKPVVTANKALLAQQARRARRARAAHRDAAAVRGRRRRGAADHPPPLAPRRRGRQPDGDRQRHLQLRDHAPRAGRAAARSRRSPRRRRSGSPRPIRPPTSTATTPPRSCRSSPTARSARGSRPTSCRVRGIGELWPADCDLAEAMGFRIRLIAHAARRATAPDRGGRAACCCPTGTCSPRSRRSTTRSTCRLRVVGRPVAVRQGRRRAADRDRRARRPDRSRAGQLGAVARAARRSPLVPRRRAATTCASPPSRTPGSCAASTSSCAAPASPCRTAPPAASRCVTHHGFVISPSRRRARSPSSSTSSRELGRVEQTLWLGVVGVKAWLDPASCPAERPPRARWHRRPRELHAALDAHARTTASPWLHPERRTIQRDLLGSPNVVAWQEAKARLPDRGRWRVVGAAAPLRALRHARHRAS